MTARDRVRWDGRYTDQHPLTPHDCAIPTVFAQWVDLFPTSGTALDIACGRGAGSVWLAQRGLDVLGVDISPVALGQAAELADRCGVADRCRFVTADLDDGLPDGPATDVILCARFRDARLDQAIMDRLAPGGLVAMSACTEGRFAVTGGELSTAFAALNVIAEGTDQATAWLLAQRGR